MMPVVNSAPIKVFSFVREKDGDKVFAVINFSRRAADASPSPSPCAQRPLPRLRRAAQTVAIDAGTAMTLCALEPPGPDGGRLGRAFLSGAGEAA